MGIGHWVALVSFAAYGNLSRMPSQYFSQLSGNRFPAALRTFLSRFSFLREVSQCHGTERQIEQSTGALDLDLFDLGIVGQRRRDGGDTPAGRDGHLIVRADAEVAQGGAALSLDGLAPAMLSHRLNNDGNRTGNRHLVAAGILGQIPQRPQSLLLHGHAGHVAAHGVNDDQYPTPGANTGLGGGIGTTSNVAQGGTAQLLDGFVGGMFLHPPHDGLDGGILDQKSSMVGINRQILQNDASPLNDLEGPLVSDHGRDEGGYAGGLDKVLSSRRGAGGLHEAGEDGDGQFFVGFGQGTDVPHQTTARVRHGRGGFGRFAGFGGTGGRLLVGGGRDRFGVGRGGADEIGFGLMLIGGQFADVICLVAASLLGGRLLLQCTEHHLAMLEWIDSLIVHVQTYPVLPKGRDFRENEGPWCSQTAMLLFKNRDFGTCCARISMYE